MEKHLIPYMKDIFACPYFWGDVEDKHAEEILADKPDGSFLLHKSKNSDYLLRVSYKQSLKLYNNQYDFILHRQICRLDTSNAFRADHQINLKDLPTNSSNESCTVEKTLKIPVHRKNPFSLQKLTRAVIADSTNFQDVNKLKLPKKLQEFVQEYQCSQPWPKDSLPIFHCDDFLPELVRDEIGARVESLMNETLNSQIRQFIAAINASLRN